MKVLVAGGLGFIGSETVVSLLENKYDVIIVDDLSNSKRNVLKSINKITNKSVKFYKFDLRNEKKLDKLFKKENFDAVINLAGFKAVGESCSKPLAYYDNNVNCTLNLLRCMEKYDVKKFVFSSSATVYGLPKSNKPFKEGDPIQSATCPYGQTKIVIERIIEDFAVCHPNYSFALLRYFNPIGAHPSGLLGEDPQGIPNNLFPYVSKVALKQLPTLHIYGKNYKTKDGTGVRDYIHVCDLAYGHVLALRKLNKVKGVQVWNLGTGKGTSVLEIVKTYEKVTGAKINYKFEGRRPGDLAVSYANCDKAKRELGFVCKRTIADACKDDFNFRQKNSK